MSRVGGALQLAAAGAVLAALGSVAEAQPIALDKRADRATASTGDVVSYRVSAVNGSGESRRVYVLDAMPAGANLVPGASMAAVIDAGGATTARSVDRRENPRSRRLIRFGPFELPAGARLELSYQAVVDVTAEGELVNRAVVIDEGGVPLSPSATALVRVGRDAMLDDALVVGRVFCDDDGDGRRDAGERGLMGARVVIDTGSYALADSDGRYHLSQVPPGTHVVKLDAGSLRGGRVLGDDREVVHLTRGLPVRISFPVACALEEVGGDHPRAVVARARPEPEPEPAAVELRGDVDAMTATLGGEGLELPAATLALDDPSLRSPARATFAAGARGLRVERWTLRIARADDGAVVAQVSGEGAPPVAIEWVDGEGLPGATLYWAQLEVRGGDRRALSARVPLGIDYGLASGAPVVRELRGRLFAGSARAPTATGELRKQVAALAAEIPAGAAVVVEAHWDGTGDRLPTIARTKRQADLVAALLVEAGVPANAIRAVGRGSLDPLAPGTGKAARERNKRVRVEITPPAADAVPIPATIAGAASASVDGAAVAVDGATFAATLRPGAAARVVMVARDGRAAELTVAPGGATTPRAEVTLVGDAGTGTFAIDGAPLPPGLLQLSAAARGELVDGAVAFDLSAPGDLAIASWSVVAGAAGADAMEPIAGGEGAPPAELRWVPPGPGLYRYALRVELADGSTGSSPARAVELSGGGAAAWPGVSLSGRNLFNKRGALRARLKNFCSLFVTETAERPAGERYLVTVRIGSVSAGDGSAAEGNLALAARGARLKKYLAALGLPEDRFELDVAAAPAGTSTDSVAIAPVAGSPSVRDGAEPAPPPAVAIDGVAQPVADGHVRATVPVAGERVVIEVSGAAGARARYVTRVATVPTAPAAPAAAPATGSVRAADFRVIVPRASARLGNRRVAVTGRTAPGNRITVNDRPAPVGADGSFAVTVELSPGKRSLAIRSVDPDGNAVDLAWPVEIAQTELVTVAMAEGVVATEDVALDGMTEHTTLDLGPIKLHGRAAAFVVGRLGGYRVTGHVDTGRREDDQPFFDQLHDPTRDFATFGDSAEEVRAARGRGPLYLRVEDDHTSAVIGNIHGEVGGGELLRHRRTVYGAAITLTDVGWTPDHQFDVTAYSGFGETTLSRDVNLLRATGGSLYYLRNGGVVEGSEVVRIIVRDRDTGLVLSERAAARDTDYAIDYAAGRLLFHEPVGSVTASPWILDNLEASVTPMDGNPVYIEVQYEHERDGELGDRGVPTGLYVRDTMYGVLALGIGVAGEGRIGQGDYALWGADASYELGERSVVRGELAASHDGDGVEYLSEDGGLGYAALGGDAGGDALGWKLAADLSLGELWSSPFARATEVSVYAQSLDLGFSSAGTVLERGRTKYGASATHKATDRDLIAVRHRGELAERPELGDRASYVTGVQWARTAGAWVYRAELGHQRLDLATADGDLGFDRYGLGGGASYRLADDLTLRATQEVQLGTDGDPQLDGGVDGIATTVGATWRVAPGLDLVVDEAVRWNGDNATRIGLRTDLSDTGSVYVHERVGGDGGRFRSSTVVGAEDRLPSGARTYGEYQLENGVGGRRNRAVLGLGHKWEIAAGVRLGLGFEHQQGFGGVLPDGTPIGDNQRDVLHASAGYTRRDDFKAAGRVELRFDDGVAGELAFDPDAAAAVGGDPWPDHGGVAPGAPLTLPPRERRQIVAGVGFDWRLLRDHTLIGRLRLSHTEETTRDRALPEDVPDSWAVARFSEGVVGWAYRPVAHDWLDVYAQYAIQLDQRPPLSYGMAAPTRFQSVALAPLVRLPYRLSLSGKIAWKESRALVQDLPAGELDATSHALLWLVRLGYRFYGKWDVAAEYRELLLLGPDPGGDQLLRGGLFEVSYALRGRLRLGLGYNLSRFSDNELGDLQRDGHGMFIRVVGHY